MRHLIVDVVSDSLLLEQVTVVPIDLVRFHPSDPPTLALVALPLTKGLEEEEWMYMRDQKEKEEKEGKKVLRSERYYGNVYRSFTLGQEVDQGAAKAKYSDGVLELTLPKKPGSTAKQLTVS